MTSNRSLTPGTSGSRVFSGFLRVLNLSLLAVALAFSPLHAQTVAYVVNDNSNSVSVIDTASNIVTATIPVGPFPVGIVFSPDGERAYVTNGVSNATISVINTATSSITATITLPCVAPDNPAITPDGNTLYVPCSFPNSVQVVSTSTNTVTDMIPIGHLFVASVAITPDGKRAYVQSFNTVSVIDAATNTVVAEIPVKATGSGVGIAITPSGGTVYVVGGEEPLVTAISTVNNTVIAVIPTPFPFPNGPGTIAITPDGSRAYVGGFLDAVGVIDTASNAVTGTITPFVIPVGLAITPDGSSVYVADNSADEVSVIDTATNTIVATVPVGSSPVNVATANLNALFAAFTIKNLNISPQGFHEQGDFTLGANSQGIDLARQMVTLTIGSFSLNIPAGSFRQVGGNHHFELNATINGLQVSFSLKADQGSNTDFDYVVNVNGVNLTSQPDPVIVGLKIGNNTGTTTRQF